MIGCSRNVMTDQLDLMMMNEDGWMELGFADWYAGVINIGKEGKKDAHTWDRTRDLIISLARTSDALYH